MKTMGSSAIGWFGEGADEVEVLCGNWLGDIGIVGKVEDCKMIQRCLIMENVHLF